jgi:hypothetical protein
MSDTGAGDPTGLSLADLRAERSALQDADDVVSYLRRAAQARLDLARAEAARRVLAAQGVVEAVDPDISGELRRVLSNQLRPRTPASGAPRPPREERFDMGDDERARELDQICADLGFSRLGGLSDDDLSGLIGALEAFERAISDDRRQRFERIDALSAELARRYRDGEVDVDALFSDGNGNDPQ